MSVYGLYREAFLRGLVANLCAIESFLCPKYIDATNPTQPQWFDLNIHNQLETVSHDKQLIGEMEELQSPGTIKSLTILYFLFKNFYKKYSRYAIKMNSFYQCFSRVVPPLSEVICGCSYCKSKILRFLEPQETLLNTYAHEKTVSL